MAELTADFRLHGEAATVEQAETLKSKGLALIDEATDTVQVQLGALQSANSVTVALLVAWYRAANLQNKSIVFSDVPTSLRAIIDVSGLAEVLAPASTAP